jgi:hypothetical protein
MSWASKPSQAAQGKPVEALLGRMRDARRHRHPLLAGHIGSGERNCLGGRDVFPLVLRAGQNLPSASPLQAQENDGWAWGR